MPNFLHYPVCNELFRRWPKRWYQGFTCCVRFVTPIVSTPNSCHVCTARKSLLFSFSDMDSVVSEEDEPSGVIMEVDYPPGTCLRVRRANL